MGRMKETWKNIKKKILKNSLIKIINKKKLNDLEETDEKHWPIN